jgi:hypothetical protein
MYKVWPNFSLEFGGEIGYSRNYYSAYMMYSRHSSLAQLFGDDSDGFRSVLDDDGSDMEICGGVRGGPFLGVLRLEGVNFPYLGFLSPQIPLILFLGI